MKYMLFKYASFILDLLFGTKTSCTVGSYGESDVSLRVLMKINIIRNNLMHINPLFGYESFKLLKC